VGKPVSNPQKERPFRYLSKQSSVSIYLIYD